MKNMAKGIFIMVAFFASIVMLTSSIDERQSIIHKEGHWVLQEDSAGVILNSKCLTDGEQCRH